MTVSYSNYTRSNDDAGTVQML